MFSLFVNLFIYIYLFTDFLTITGTVVYTARVSIVKMLLSYPSLMSLRLTILLLLYKFLISINTYIITITVIVIIYSSPSSSSSSSSSSCCY